MRLIISCKICLALVLVSLQSAQGSNYKMPLYLNTTYFQNSNIADHRSFSLGQVPTSTQNNFDISQILFNFGIHASRGTDYASQVEFELPLRTVNAVGSMSERSGSEFGGYGIKWKQVFLSFLAVETSYQAQSSPVLGLFKSSHNFEASTRYITKAFLTPSVLVQALIGPGIRVTKSKDSNTAYGPMYSAMAGVEATFQSAIGKISIGVNATFHQRSSYTEGSQQVMATLFNLKPQIAWEIIEDLWVSAKYNSPLARPMGFEQSMGDSSLEGLYGQSFGIGITTASF